MTRTERKPMDSVDRAMLNEALWTAIRATGANVSVGTQAAMLRDLAGVDRISGAGTNRLADQYDVAAPRVFGPIVRDEFYRLTRRRIR